MTKEKTQKINSLMTYIDYLYDNSLSKYEYTNARHALINMLYRELGEEFPYSDVKDTKLAELWRKLFDKNLEFMNVFFIMQAFDINKFKNLKLYLSTMLHLNPNRLQIQFSYQIKKAF